MSAEKIAEVLAAHQFKTGYRDMLLHCTCGWVSSGYELKRREHRAHQAEMVAAALEPVGVEREKAAWDAGVTTALNHAVLQEDGITLRLEHLDGRPWANPYDTKEEV